MPGQASEQTTSARREAVIARLLDEQGRPQQNLSAQPPLSTKDVAALLLRSERTVRWWAEQGRLAHTYSLGRGRLQFPADQIARVYLESMGKVLNEEV